MIIRAGIVVLPAIVTEGLGPASIFAYLLCGLLVVRAITIAKLAPLLVLILFASSEVLSLPGIL